MQRFWAPLACMFLAACVAPEIQLEVPIVTQATPLATPSVKPTLAPTQSPVPSATPTPAASRTPMPAPKLPFRLFWKVSPPIEFAQAVFDAIEEWNRVLKTEAFSLENGLGTDIQLIFMEKPVVGRPDISAQTHITEGMPWQIDFRLDMSPQDRSRMALHEMGHVLGLDHSNDPNTVMYWKVYRNRLTTEDIDRGRVALKKLSRSKL